MNKNVKIFLNGRDVPLKRLMVLNDRKVSLFKRDCHNFFRGILPVQKKCEYMGLCIFKSLFKK